MNYSALTLLLITVNSFIKMLSLLLLLLKKMNNPVIYVLAGN